MKRQSASSLIVAALLLASCGGNGPDVGPENTSSGNGNPGGATPPAPNTAGTALFQPLQGVLPYPTDAYFKDSTDGTLNIQPANALMPLQASVNALDGFSTTAVIRTRFATPINPASLDATTVHVAQVVVDSATKATVGFTRRLVVAPVASADPATADISVGVANDAQVGSTIVELRPLKPLVPSTGPDATNVGYLVVLTNGITMADGSAARPDTDYDDFKAKLSIDPSCSVITNTSLNGLCRLTGAHLRIAAQALQLNPANIVLTFSFSTQATRDTMNELADPAVTTAQPIAVVNTGATTTAIASALPGHANLYRGTFRTTYYGARPTQQNPTAPLTVSWQGNPSPLDANSRLLTRFNPLPVATATFPIPILVTVPNASSAGGGLKPASGWPVVIFQHGLTRSRMDAAAVADGLADAGYVVASIDLPLHGIAGASATATNPFYDAANERTFNLDFVNNTSLATGPDGVIDGSGTHFVQVPNPLVTRDNLRQGAVDLLSLARSLPSLDLDGNGTSDIDPTRIHFIGHSLGGIVGTPFLAAASGAEVRTGELANAGGGIAQTIFDSPAFGPRIKAGLQAQGIAEGTTLYAQFVRDAQTVVDSGDPLTYIEAAKAARPLLLFQVVGGGTRPDGTTSPSDQVVVNCSTQRLIDAGAFTQISTAGDNPATSGYVNFLLGDHGSIISPESSPATTVEMQTESIVFASSLGTIVRVTNPTVVQPSGAPRPVCRAP